MRAAILIVGALIATYGAALAGLGSGPRPQGFTPFVCSNSLSFIYQCNSQYLAITGVP